MDSADLPLNADIDEDFANLHDDFNISVPEFHDADYNEKLIMHVAVVNDLRNGRERVGDRLRQDLIRQIGGRGRGAGAGEEEEIPEGRAGRFGRIIDDQLEAEIREFNGNRGFPILEKDNDFLLVHYSRDFRNSYPPGIYPPPPLMSVPIQRPLMHPQHRLIQNPPGIQNPQIQNPPQYQNPASFDNYEEVSMEMDSPDEPQPEHDPFARPPIQIPLEAVTSTPSGAPESSTTATSATPETEESLRQYLLSQLGSKRTAEEKPQKSAKRSRRGSSQKSENQKKHQEMEKMFEDTTPIEPKPPTPKIAIGKIDGNSTKIAPKSSILAQNSTQNASNLSILTRNSPKPSIFASKSSSLSPSTPDFSFFTQNSQKTTSNNPFLAQKPVSTGPFFTQIVQNPAPTARNAQNSAEYSQNPSPMF